MPSTSVRIDVDTREELKRLAARLGLTVGHTVTLAVRALRQERRPSSRPTPTTPYLRRLRSKPVFGLFVASSILGIGLEGFTESPR
jgi:hypothetical protein